MGLDPFDPDEMTETKSDAEMFKADRLDRDTLTKSQWPSQIDRAALDIQYGIAVGKSDDIGDIGGVIGRHDFGRATGGYYIEGLEALTGDESSVVQTLRQYQDSRIGKFVFQLNAFRHKLNQTGQSMDIDRALEALLEKQAAAAIGQSSYRDKNAGAGLRQLRDTDSVADLTLKLFSDPSIDVYAEQLMDRLPDSTAERAELFRQLDAPHMTTPLWDHQRAALSTWIDKGQMGYVNMATATGKTVLGLAAIAYRYGRLHPADSDRGLAPQGQNTADRPRVLIVAGNEVLLKQWRDEFDEHLDIPKARTEPLENEAGATIELDWGEIDFRTTQRLLEEEDFSRYDLTILDEAHRYTRGSTSGRGWGDLFDTLTDQSTSLLAMSGSVDGGWTGDAGARDALEQQLDECLSFGVAKARDQGVIADFSWQIFYAPAATVDEQKLANQTSITTSNYDAATGQVDTDSLHVDDDDVPTPFHSYGDIRSFAQSNAGNELREESKEFDMFASALLTRQPLRWNMSPVTDVVGQLIDRHAPRQKTVILVQSYDEATEIGEYLVDDLGHPSDRVIVLESGSEDRHSKIQEFNAIDGGVIVGPGNLLGVGVDMPDAEIAINIAKGKVNPSLVQRIGRVLRNPEGDKDAQFYHVVPQPFDDDAIDYVEDGMRVLAQAAEFVGLGDTFKETPTFATAGEYMSSTLIQLENNGVELLDRLEDEDRIVDLERATEHLRRLQADIYDAQSAASDQRDHPVLTTNWGATESGQDDQSETIFPERNEAYEQYRLSLGPYRAAKAAAANHLDADVSTDEENGDYQVDLPDEYEGTEYHSEFEQWFEDYRGWRERCDNRVGEGEPGSLPQYKEHWPEPRDSDGAMLTAEAAATIGVDYSESDPIFFPRTDDGIYELPLPDGTWLTVEGITDQPPAEREADDQPDQYTLSLYTLRAAQQEIEDRPAETLDDVVDDALSELLKSALDDEPITDLSNRSTPRERVQLEIPATQREMATVIVEDPAEDCDSIDALIETALADYLDIDLSKTETLSITVDGQLSVALETLAAEDDDVEDPTDIVERAVEEYIAEEF